ncbi:MAG: hypothetical protein PHF86_15040 [Candidatus Nanoarchaeia archaeon]|jgi:hypothetical protein|nr:hypothetical protein [Candidatus Nanoarchaeia archaeon]
MTEKEKEALEESIFHWWENLFLAYFDLLKLNDINGSKCALCKLVRDRVYPCSKCIIYKKTGGSHCGLTPYFDVQDLVYNEDQNIEVIKKESLILSIIKEIDFLEGLRE